MLKKILLIGIKDVRLAFRDRAALLLMLLAPFLLTIGLGFVTGRFSGSSVSAGVSQIPVLIVNQDGEQLGDTLVEVFQSAELAELVLPSVLEDPVAARQQVDADQVAAAIIIPEGYTSSIIPAQGQAETSAVVEIEIYANPSRPTSAGIIQTIVEQFNNRVELSRISGEVTMLQLIKSGRIPLDQSALEAASQQLSQQISGSENTQSQIALVKEQQSEKTNEFDVLAYLAPGMALMFLMYTVTYGGRSLLVERNQGTLPRLLVSPTRIVEVLGGKIMGIYFTGIAQIAILILASTMMFQVQWGDPLGIIVLILAAVFGATGWGILLTSLARTPGQIASVGSALMLTFGILGGTFISLDYLPPVVRLISRITPNAWGMEGFNTLAMGGGLAEITRPVLALLAMGAILFAAAALFFNRRAILQK